MRGLPTVDRGAGVCCREHDVDVWKRLRELYRLTMKVTLHLDGWTRGFELSAPLVGRLARLGLSIGFSIYAHGEDPPSGDRLA
jgi:hypothetical protein